MLFNSFIFLLAFLPAALALHALAERYRPDWRLPTLVLLSFVFYGWWDVRFLPLLLASIGLNWLVMRAFVARPDEWLIPLAIGANLLVLALFKYLNFLADLLTLLPGVAAPHLDWVLPLGISFFTFHHIMYLTDLKAAARRPSGSPSTRSTSPSSRRFSPARSCAGARSCTSSTSAPTRARTPWSGSDAASCCSPSALRRRCCSAIR